MSKMKITFRKEVEVDLNAYYPSFTGSLRKAIDDAIYGLLGGSTKQPPRASRSSIPNDTLWRRTVKQVARPNSKLAALLADLAREKGGEHFKEDIVKCAKQHGLGDPVMSNLIRNGYIVAVKAN